MPGMGRIHVEDPRDNAFMMRALALDPLIDQFFPRGIPEGTRHYAPGPLLDQGDTGTCVAHGVTTRVNSAPIMQSLPDGLTPYDMYRRIVVIDEFSDNDIEATLPNKNLQYGTSVRAGFKVGQEMGLFKNYLWAKSAEDVRAWMLAGFGGVVLGINWTSDMMNADADGFISYTGNILGGHAVATVSWSDRRKRKGRYVRACRIQQSWGPGWGEYGRGTAWIEFDELEQLIRDDGEAGAPTEVRVTPPRW